MSPTDRFDLDLLRDDWPFEIDMCRPIGCYEASAVLAALYREDR